MLHGIAVSEGIGLGKVMHVGEETLEYGTLRTVEAAVEQARFHQAMESFRKNTSAQVEVLRLSAGQEDARILESHIEMVSDPELQEEIDRLIESGSCAEAALKEVCDQYVDAFLACHDELTRLRAEDIRDMCTALLCVLLGVEKTDLGRAPKGTVLVAKELSPSVMSSIDKERIVGIVTEKGGMTSHASILARAMGVPAVCGVPGAVKRLWEGAFIIADGTRGEVVCDPTPEQIEEYQRRREASLESQARMKRFLHRKTLSASGESYRLYCNISMPSGAARAVEAGGEGVGLFRTEYLYMNCQQPPSEEEQTRAYIQTAQALQGRPLVVRTLDVGGDKTASCLNLEPEENPFLGLRGIRWCLAHKDVFMPQLRAILRASAQGDLRIMLPMVSTMEELREARAMLREARRQLAEEGAPRAENLPVGVMIETPSAVMMADRLAEEADFFSVGTNDLVGYVMASERGNAAVAGLYSPFQPAVVRALRHVVRTGRKHGLSVTICGEAAADQRLVPLLMAFGVSGFSVSQASVLAVRRAVAQWTLAEAERLAEKVLAMETEAEIAAYLGMMQAGHIQG